MTQPPTPPCECALLTSERAEPPPAEPTCNAYGFGAEKAGFCGLPKGHAGPHSGEPYDGVLRARGAAPAPAAPPAEPQKENTDA